MASFLKPTNEQVEKVIPLLSAPQHARYFFDSLENPLWIEPLRARGFFKQPHFEEVAYLVRMAPEAPTEVGAILKDLAVETQAAARQLLEAASRLPTEAAAPLAESICGAHERGLLNFALMDAGDFCARLADAGDHKTALRLARCLFRVREGDNLDEMTRRATEWYFEAFVKVIAPLTRADPKGFVSFLLHGLKVVADAKAVGSTDPEYDASPWWRPAIEEHSQNSDFHFESRYVGSVRTSLELAIQQGLLTVDDVFTHLTVSPRLIFGRLRLHLINAFAHLVPDLAKQMLMDQSLLDDYRYKHEYAMLCRDRFPLLDRQSQEKWLGWVDAGPDMSDFDAEIKEMLGRDATQEDRDKRIQYWQYEHLHWIRMHLTGDRLAKYERMKTEQGEPTMADMNVHHGPVRWGYESPFDLDHLASKSFGDVVTIVSSWQPDRPDRSSFIGPSIEGLADTFEKYLSAAPDRYVVEARLMMHRVPIFVRTYIEAAKAVVGQAEIDLGPLLDLCKWVVDQPSVREPQPEDAFDTSEHVNWQASRDAVSELICAICHAKPSMEHRDRLWSLVEPLTHDTGKSYLVDPTTVDPRIADHVLRAINSPAGKAMEALFAYARWIAGAKQVTSENVAVVEGGFEQLPEVRRLLEEHIAHGEPGRFALRAVIGMHWSWIYWLDREWLSSHANVICDLRHIEVDPQTAYAWAAWNAFLGRTPPHIDYYRMLREQFAYAVEQAAKIVVERAGDERPCDQLAEHLIVLYSRGDIGIEDDDGIIRRLLTATVEGVRTHAVEFVGASLWRDTAARLPEEVHQRLTALWDFYWLQSGRCDAQSHSTSSVFGMWFVSRAFDMRWALDRLEEVVSVVPKPEPQEEIVKTLEEAISINLPQVVRVLEALINGDDENWRIYSWKEHAKKILSEALRVGGDTRERARGIINNLGRRGFKEFGELLVGARG